MTLELTKAFADASRRAESELEQICLGDIHELGISKTHSDLLGSHTAVTYPPLDSLREIAGNRLFKKLQFQSEIDAYIHIPFCEYPCKFCPYTTLSISGKDGEQMPDYMEVLKVEIKTWSKKLREQNAQVRSLYIGGGTPFAISAGQLEDIMVFVGETLPFIENPEICVETSPRATLQDDAQRKLDILKGYGTTRMSIGIQSFDFESLRDMARTFRGHTPDDEERAVKVLLESGIENINVDMIQDLPLQSTEYLERLQQDLIKIARLKPPHVTWYNFRLRPETTYARREGLPVLNNSSRQVTEEQSLLTRLTIWNFLGKIGYIMLEGDRFALADSYEDNFRKARGSVETDLLGMGVSAYSHVGKTFFQNAREIGSTVREDSRRAVERR